MGLASCLLTEECRVAIFLFASHPRRLVLPRHSLPSRPSHHPKPGSIVAQVRPRQRSTGQQPRTWGPGERRCSTSSAGGLRLPPGRPPRWRADVGRVRRWANGAVIGGSGKRDEGGGSMVQGEGAEGIAEDVAEQFALPGVLPWGIFAFQGKGGIPAKRPPGRGC